MGETIKLLLVVLVTVGVLQFVNSSSELRIWEREFGVYWVACTMHLAGDNPYDEAKLRAAVQLHNLNFTGPLYTPPWVNVILLPLGLLPFHLASDLFFAINIVAIIASIKFARSIQPTATRWCWELLAIFYLPAILPLIVGQISLIVTVSAYALVASAVQGRWFYSGMFLGICTVKPHLVGLLGLYILVRAPGKSRAQFLSGGVVSLTALCLTGTIFWSESLSAWYSTNREPLQWLGASPVTWIRLLVGTKEQPFPTWPVYPWALLGTLLTLAIALGERGRPFDARSVPLVLSLSLLFSPYAWFFDFAILLLVVIHGIGAIRSKDSPIQVTILTGTLIALPWALFVSGVWGHPTASIGVIALLLALSLRQASRWPKRMMHK
jgi:hypothetical protein